MNGKGEKERGANRQQNGVGYRGIKYSTSVHFVCRSRSEKIIQFLAIFTFSLFFGLLIMQVNMAWQSYQVSLNIQHVFKQFESHNVIRLFVETLRYINS